MRSQRGAALGGYEWALRLTIPTLLLAIALVQIVRTEQFDQSSWSGAGYGMFATFENEDTRFVRAYALENGGRRRLAVSDNVDEEAEETFVVPTSSNARTLARAIQRDHDLDVAVRVEIWAIDVRTSHRRVHVLGEPIRVVEVGAR